MMNRLIAAGLLAAAAGSYAATSLEPAQMAAARLALHASFGPTESLVSEIRSTGLTRWVQLQMVTGGSRYTLGQGDAVHRNASGTPFCSQAAYAGSNCWRDWYSTTPLLWDFYRNATSQPDQLRQRVAFALQQMLVVSELKVTGTYGFRVFHNGLLDRAFTNYREVLRFTATSPLMGAYLDQANNDPVEPNENFSRELLQLFAIGACLLNPDGTQVGAVCTPAYDNNVVRRYAMALTGWTYPAGGAAPWSCGPAGTQCPFFAGEMQPLPTRHHTGEQQLLAGHTVATGSTPQQALDSVLDSLMAHPNMAPFIGRQLIQHLVSSNPSRSYVQRVAKAFTAGRHVSGTTVFGSGQGGDLAATVAAVILDPEARSTSPTRTAGSLRPPALMMAAILRAFHGRTDGDALSYQWGEPLRQHLFRSPSVFNFYPPDFPVAGTTLHGPAFAIHNGNTALERLNFLTYLVYWGGSSPVASVPGAIGTRIDLAPFETSAADAAALVDRLSLLAIGGLLPAGTRDTVVAAVEAADEKAYPTTWRTERVKQAAYLVFASPAVQAHR